MHVGMPIHRWMRARIGQSAATFDFIAKVNRWTGNSPAGLANLYRSRHEDAMSAMWPRARARL